MLFKIVHNKELHIYNPKDQSSFEAIHKYIREVFKQLPSQYYLTYFDEEDEITLACQSDFEILKQIAQKTVKIFIKEVDESYYDQTQKIVLDDEMLEPLEEKMEELKLSESEEPAEPEQQKAIENQNQVLEKPETIQRNQAKLDEQNSQPQIIQLKSQKSNQYNPILAQSEIHCSQISQITEAQIQEKFRQMIPEFMEKVKDSLLRQSTVRSEACQKPKIVHNNIICDECGKKNIEGVRYKCAVCADFDLCEQCEATSNHDHPLLKIKHPGQAPYKLIAIIRDEQQNAFEVNGQRVTIPEIPFVNQLFQAFCPRSGRQSQERFGHQSHRNWFGRGRHGCPYKNRQEKNFETKPEEKFEQKLEPQKKTKIEQEKPVQKKVEKKLQEKIQEKNIPAKQQICAQNKKEQMQIKKPQLDESVQNAKYLLSVLNGFAQISQAQSLDFALKHPGQTKEQLVQLYFSQKF